ncbi:MAG: hypothetical protein WCK65_11295, partial [Rhodospirillaceae bacterium]
MAKQEPGKALGKEINIEDLERLSGGAVDPALTPPEEPHDVAAGGLPPAPPAPPTEPHAGPVPPVDPHIGPAPGAIVIAPGPLLVHVPGPELLPGPLPSPLPGPGPLPGPFPGPIVGEPGP